MKGKDREREREGVRVGGVRPAQLVKIEAALYTLRRGRGVRKLMSFVFVRFITRK